VLARIRRVGPDANVLLSYNFGTQLVDEQSSIRLQITGRLGREVLQVNVRPNACLLHRL
jgi:hypothetical protein